MHEFNFMRGALHIYNKTFRMKREIYKVRVTIRQIMHTEEHRSDTAMPDSFYSFAFLKAGNVRLWSVKVGMDGSE